MVQTRPVEEEHRRITIQTLEALFPNGLPDSVRVRLWDGSMWPDYAQEPEAQIVLNHPGALRNMLLAGNEVGLGEAYVNEDFDVSGDLEKAFECAESLERNVASIGGKLNIGSLLLRLPVRSRKVPYRGSATLNGQVHSLSRDREAVSYHYDVSNEFYALWLDRQMVYSCAYFETPADSIDVAQENKLDYICRKLRLAPGQRLLDIGCGWGALVAFAAANYGVRARGVTLSKPQAEYATELLQSLGLSDRAHVSLLDYRDITASERYDAIVSVGMFEHVGRETLPGYFQKVFQLLRPGGVFLNHGIASGSARQQLEDRNTSFSQNYVFPDGELVPISTTLRTAHEAGFEIRDLESLREHYQLTLRHWVHRLESNRDAVIRHVDEPTYRVWRLFMAGGAYGFGVGSLNVYQALFVRPTEQGRSGLSLTREDWYR